MASVLFSDGTSIEFSEKAKVKKYAGVRPDGVPEIKFYFSSGTMRTFECPAELLAKAAAHGLSQKIGDSFAGVDSVDDCILAFDEMAERLGKGEWNAEREVGAGVSGSSVLARAIAEFTGQPLEAVKEKLKTYTPKQKTAMRQSASLKPIIDRIEAEKVKKSDPIDTEGLLAGFAD